MMDARTGCHVDRPVAKRTQSVDSLPAGYVGLSGEDDFARILLQPYPSFPMTRVVGDNDR